MGIDSGAAGAGGGGPSSAASRLGYLDWARGLAVLVMIETHALYSWTVPEDRETPLFGWTRLIGGYPAALFLFLAGLAAALVAEKALERGAALRDVRRRALRRGLEVLGWAALFRLWMFASSSFARAADLLRVDVLNCIGVSLLLVAAVGLAPRTARARGAAAGALAVAVALFTPLAWDGPWWQGWPAPLLAYVSGRPPDAIFPVFPWACFAALGSAAGVALAAARRRGREGEAIAWMTTAGAAAIPCAWIADRFAPAIDPRYDFWHTSPTYTLLKAGMVVLLVGAAYVLDRLPGPSPLRQLGRTSLLVYWVHLEIVYGQWIAPAARGHLPIAQASSGVVVLVLAMLALSLARTGLRVRPLGARPLAKA